MGTTQDTAELMLSLDLDTVNTAATALTMNHRAGFRPLSSDELTITTADDIDIILGPDPGPRVERADGHYARIGRGNPDGSLSWEFEQQAEAAFRRHCKDLQDRYKLTRTWEAQDFSISDLRLCWTQRQLMVALITLAVALLLVSGGILFSSWIAILVGAVATVAVTPFVARDGWRRAHEWMLEERRS